MPAATSDELHAVTSMFSDDVPAQLATFLARHAGCAIGEESATWRWEGYSLPLVVTGYLSPEPPPIVYVSSVRALVFRSDSVLVQRDRIGFHIWPGGRREAGELPEATLRREVLEEAGWSIRTPSPLGFLHLHHVGPAPRGYPYLHPDFLQAVYWVDAAAHLPEAVVPDDHVIDSAFQPLRDVRAGTPALPPMQREFLEAALRLRSDLDTSAERN